MRKYFNLSVSREIRIGILTVVAIVGLGSSVAGAAVAGYQGMSFFNTDKVAVAPSQSPAPTAY